MPLRLQNVGVRALLPKNSRYCENSIRAGHRQRLWLHPLEDYVEGDPGPWKMPEGLAATNSIFPAQRQEGGYGSSGGDPALVAEVGGPPEKPPPRDPVGSNSPSGYRHWTYCRAAEEAGRGRALTVANTYPAMAIDFRTGKSRLGNKTGGLSGPRH